MANGRIQGDPLRFVIIREPDNAPGIPIAAADTSGPHRGTELGQVSSSTALASAASQSGPSAQTQAVELDHLETAFSELLAITASQLRKRVSQRAVDLQDPPAKKRSDEGTFLLSPGAVAALSDSTRALFQRAKVPPETTSLPELHRALASLSRHVVGAVRASRDEAASRQTAIAGPQTTVARIGDLMLVQEATERYEATEIAHIENVLARELKERLHVRERTVEEIVVTETEQTKETEFDLESTEQFELSNEMTETVNQREAMEVGVSVSAGYGPYVQVDSNFGYQTETNQERVRRSASKFSREVTERAVTRIKERVREQRTRRTIETFKEQNTHRIDNTSGPKHLVGIYRWVNKISRLQTFNYGRRLLLRLVVPEPGVFLRYAQLHAPTKGMTVKPPPPFDLTPRDITLANWFLLARTYGVADIEPPPEPFRTLGWNTKSEKTGRVSAAGLIKIPEGYQTVSAEVDWYFEKEKEQNVALVRYAVGPAAGGMLATGAAAFYVGDETHTVEAWGELPVAAHAAGTAAHFLNVTVLCKTTSAAYDEWRTRVYAQLLTAFLDQKTRFEEQLAAQAAQAAGTVQGQNPALNRLVELAELKKHCVMILVNSPVFDYIGGIREGTYGYPEVDLTVANPPPGGLSQGFFIGFMEDLFEWTNLSYTLFPYLWGRKQEWLDLNGVPASDPLFLRFLQAGAAQVTLPVRPGKEAIALHLLATRQTWPHSYPPPPPGPEYRDLVADLTAHPPEEKTPVPVDEGWLVTTPTDLLFLQPGAALPHLLQPTADLPDLSVPS